MSTYTSDPALDGDRDMDPEDGSAWLDETGMLDASDEPTAQPERFIVRVTQSYEVEATSFETALAKFEEEDSTFVDEDVAVVHEDDAE